jgi:hypothetical protein
LPISNPFKAAGRNLRDRLTSRQVPHPTPLSNGQLGSRRARQVDRENASGPREIADSQHAIVRFNAASADVESQPETRSILAALNERQQEIFGRPCGQSPAVILDLYQDAIRHEVRM